MLHAPCSLPHAAPRGFTLAEVMIAMVITSFALLTLISILPEGLQSLQNAQRRSAEARIVQHLTSRYQLMPWNEISQASSQRDFEFDANGNPVEPARRESVFRARVEVLTAAPLPNEIAPSPFLRRLRIRITNQLYNGAAFNNPNLHRVRHSLLANYDPASTAAASTTPGQTSSTQAP